MTIPRVSIIIPVYEEGDQIEPCLDRILEAVGIPHEVLVVYDHDTDSTIPYVEKYAGRHPSVRGVRNDLGHGPAFAIRTGIAAASGPVAVVTMADGCDDAMQIEPLTRLVERGVVVAAASRYARGGQQVGGPVLKGSLSRMAGLTLYWLARVGTRDATNSFKAYSTAFVRTVGIQSEQGFEIGIELVAKARRARLPVAEIPTIWLDRSFGVSNFKLAAWLPRYLHWYLHSFGSSRPLDEFTVGPLPLTNGDDS